MPQYPPSVPQLPVVAFFDPNKVDQGLIEYWNVDAAPYQPLDQSTPHPNTRDYSGFRLGLQALVPDNPSWVRRVWVTDETSPDWFNYQRKFAAENNSFPTFIRQYREDKKDYAPRTKGTPLDSVYLLRLLTAGTGYIPGTFPEITATGGGGSGFLGHAIVNPDGTLADVVIDEQGTGYTSDPAFTIEAPPSGTTGTCEGFVQPQGAVLLAEQAEEFPKDSEFFGLYFNVTRVYETMPGPTLYGTAIDDDGQVVTKSTQRKLCADIDSGETLIGGIWTRVIKKETETTLICEEVIEIREIPGPLQGGHQTGKWGLEAVYGQKVDINTDPDEGYAVRESKVSPFQGSDLVGTKQTIFYPPNLYGEELPGQDYDPRLNTVIPYVIRKDPIAYGIGENFRDITPEDYQHADVRDIDLDTVRAVLNAYVFSYPGRINVDMPDLLTAVYAVVESSTSDGADQEVGSNSATGNYSIAQTLTAQAQASANILPEAYPLIKQFWGNNIACSHYHFFLENPVTLADVLTKLNGILSPDSITDWPKFNPEIVTLVMTGGRVSVQAKAHSQGSAAISGTGSASTAAGGVGYSEERGLTVKTMRISPTIHDTIYVYGVYSGSEDVSATAYAEAAGLGPLETQTTGPISITAEITPNTIQATVGATTWPTSGLYLYRTDPHPYRYNFIEFHCVVIDAADFPNVP